MHAAQSNERSQNNLSGEHCQTPERPPASGLFGFQVTDAHREQGQNTNAPANNESKTIRVNTQRPDLANHISLWSVYFPTRGSGRVLIRYTLGGAFISVLAPSRGLAVLLGLQQRTGASRHFVDIFPQNKSLRPCKITN